MVRIIPEPEAALCVRDTAWCSQQEMCQVLTLMSSSCGKALSYLGSVQVLRDQGLVGGGKVKDNTLITCPRQGGGGGR